MHLGTIPFFDQLNDSKRVLIGGAGGGWDVFSGLPLYFYLKQLGKEVFLANYSFSSFRPSAGGKIHSMVEEVTGDSQGAQPYFPEKYLSQWFREERQEEVSIWCFPKPGYTGLAEAYAQLVAHLEIDTIVLADGGSDSLLRGDEHGLGTPLEDMISIAAVHWLDIPCRKLLVSLGFGVDHHHGVCHAHVLEAVADLTKRGGFLGAITLLEQMPELALFREATSFVFAKMPKFNSIVCSSVLDALAGQFGNHHSNSRTKGSVLWINPLMTLYWCFQLNTLAERVMYLDKIKGTETQDEASQAIGELRGQVGLKSWSAIPI